MSDINRLRLVLLAAIVLAILSLVPQLPDRIATHIEKSGLVIDGDTGKPMPNVIVLAAGWSSSAPVGVGPGGYSDLYRIVTFTDEEGRYHVPSTWRDIKIGIPGSDWRTGWVVTAFRPGYAVVGDEQGWQFRKNGPPMYRSRSASETPAYSYRGAAIEVAPIVMFKPTLSLKEAASYYSEIVNVGPNKFLSKDPGDVAIQQRGYDLFAPWVCSLDPEFGMDRLTMHAITGFSADRIRARELLEQLDPLQANWEVHQNGIYKAEMVCKMITNGTGVP